MKKPLLERLENGSYLIHHLEGKPVVISAENLNKCFQLKVDNINNYELHESVVLYLKQKQFLANFREHFLEGIEKVKRGEKLINND